MGTARAMASGTVTFGLVTVPVRIYSAAESAGSVSFNQLHRSPCGSRLKQQLVCQKENVVVPADEIVKGYEFAKDQYVTFTAEELKALLEPASPAIDIVEFVPIALVDPVFFDGAYYLGPDKGGESAYALLAEALRRSKLSALARWSARGKQYLVLIRPAVERGLVMQVLHHAADVRSLAEIPIGDAPVKEGELKLAMQLVRKIAAAEFRPDAYVDEVRQRIEATIGRKVAGEEIVVSPSDGKPAPTTDLAAALKASLKKRRPSARARRAA